MIWSNRTFLLGWLATCLLLIAPIGFVTYVPLVDYPSHIARAYILRHYSEAPPYQDFFFRTREILPNMATDLLMRPLLGVMSFQAAGKAFFAILIVVFVTGVNVLACTVHGRWTNRAVLGSFFVYNSMLLAGFVNYVFSLGLFCLALAAWLAWRSEWEREWAPGRYLFCALLVFFTYVSHLAGYMLLCVVFGVICFLDWREKKRIRGVLLSLFLLLPEALLYLAFHHASIEPLSWGTFTQKIVGLLPLILTYDYRLDAGLTATGILVGLYTLRQVEKREYDRAILTAALVVFGLFCILPHSWLGGSPVDSRLIPAAALLLLLSFRFRLSARASRAVFSAVLVLSLIRLGAITASWRILSPKIAAQVELLEVLPAGKRVFPVFVESTQPGQGKLDRTFTHVVEYAAITRQAFVPTQLAVPGQETLLFRSQPLYQDVYAEPGAWLASLRNFDYVWSHNAPPEVERTLKDRCQEVASRDGFTIWRVRNSSRLR